MGIKGLWKDIERGVKLVRGKDVEVDIPDELVALISAAKNLVVREALEIVAESKEPAWEKLRTFSDLMISREAFDCVYKAIEDYIKEL